MDSMYITINVLTLVAHHQQYSAACDEVLGTEGC